MPIPLGQQLENSFWNAYDNAVARRNRETGRNDKDLPLEEGRELLRSVTGLMEDKAETRKLGVDV